MKTNLQTKEPLHYDETIASYKIKLRILGRTFLILLTITISLICLAALNVFSQHAKKVSENQLEEFSAVVKSGKVYLIWTAENETKPCIYQIERSYDGKKFKTVGLKKVAGSPLDLLYSFVDNKPLDNKEAHYRLKKVNEDGSINYSPVNSIFVNGIKNLDNGFMNSAMHTK